MSATEATPLGKGQTSTALESVRRLEETLEDRRDLEQAAEARIAGARRQAEAIVREAREEARGAAAARRRQALAHADEEAARVVAEAKARAGTLRALAGGDRPAAAREVVALVLPGRGT